MQDCYIETVIRSAGGGGGDGEHVVGFLRPRAKIIGLGDLPLRPAARISLFQLRAPLRDGLTIGGMGPVRAP